MCRPVRNPRAPTCAAGEQCVEAGASFVCVDEAELSPARWAETRKDERTQQLLAADVFRQLSLGAFDDQLDRA